jgi:predicted DsbA family dithiol-disulfide isomerase
MTSPASPLVVTVHVDFVCPWCYLGTERLDRAIAAAGLADRVVIARRPFLLAPDLPAEGVDLADHLRQKYGADPAAMFERVSAVAREDGLPLDFSRQRRFYPTVAAHALMADLIATGASEATQRAIERDLFRLNFVDGGNLADLETLVALAARHGRDPASTRAALSDPARIAQVRSEAAAASAAGLRGVPAFRFPDGATLSGAQPEATLIAALRQAAASRPR